MPTIDANVLLRWLLDDVPAQTQAVERLLAREARLAVPDVVMVEVGYMLERSMRLSRSLVADYLEAILGVTAFDVDRAVWGAAVADYRAHPKLSLVDCHLAARAATSWGAQTPRQSVPRSHLIDLVLRMCAT